MGHLVGGRACLEPFLGLDGIFRDPLSTIIKLTKKKLGDADECLRSVKLRC